MIKIKNINKDRTLYKLLAENKEHRLKCEQLKCPHYKNNYTGIFYCQIMIKDCPFKLEKIVLTQKDNNAE